MYQRQESQHTRTPGDRVVDVRWWCKSRCETRVSMLGEHVPWGVSDTVTRNAKQTRATKTAVGYRSFPRFAFTGRARARAHTHSRVITYRTAERNSRDTPASLARARMETLCSRTSHRLTSALLDRARFLRLRGYRRMATWAERDRATPRPHARTEKRF